MCARAVAIVGLTWAAVVAAEAVVESVSARLDGMGIVALQGELSELRSEVKELEGRLRECQESAVGASGEAPGLFGTFLPFALGLIAYAVTTLQVKGVAVKATFRGRTNVSGELVRPRGSRQQCAAVAVHSKGRLAMAQAQLSSDATPCAAAASPVHGARHGPTAPSGGRSPSAPHDGPCLVASASSAAATSRTTQPVCCSANAETDLAQVGPADIAEHADGAIALAHPLGDGIEDSSIVDEAGDPCSVDVPSAFDREPRAKGEQLCGEDVADATWPTITLPRDVVAALSASGFAPPPGLPPPALGRGIVSGVFEPPPGLPTFPGEQEADETPMVAGQPHDEAGGPPDGVADGAKAMGASKESYAFQPGPMESGSAGEEPLLVGAIEEPRPAEDNQEAMVANDGPSAEDIEESLGAGADAAQDISGELAAASDKESDESAGATEAPSPTESDEDGDEPPAGAAEAAARGSEAAASGAPPEPRSAGKARERSLSRHQARRAHGEVESSPSAWAMPLAQGVLQKIRGLVSCTSGPQGERVAPLKTRQPRRRGHVGQRSVGCEVTGPSACAWRSLCFAATAAAVVGFGIPATYASLEDIAVLRRLPWSSLGSADEEKSGGCSGVPPPESNTLDESSAVPSPSIGKAHVLFRGPCFLPEFAHVAQRFESRLDWHYQKDDSGIIVQIAHRHEAPVLMSTGIRDNTTILDFLDANLVPVFGKITPERYDAHLLQGAGLVWAFVSSEEEADSMRPIMAELAQRFRSRYQVGWVDSAEHKDWVYSEFGVTSFPTVIVQREPVGRMFSHSGPPTTSSLRQLVYDVEDGCLGYSGGGRGWHRQPDLVCVAVPDDDTP